MSRDVVRGDPERPPVVLLHDHDAGPDMWEDLAELLEPWMSVVAPTVVGGDPEAAADTIRRTLAARGIEEYAVVGHGRGGEIAQWLAARGGVKAMVLVGCSVVELGDRGSLPEDVPAFLIWGEEDGVVPPKTGEALMEALPGSTLAIVPDAGHDVLRTDRAQVLPLIYEYLRFRYLGRPHGHQGPHAYQRGPVPVHIQAGRQE